MPSQVPENIQPIKTLSKEQVDTLYRISYILNSTQYQDSLLEEALDLIIRVIDAERGLCATYDKASGDFTILTARNMQKESISNLSEFSSGILQKVIEARKPILYHDAQSDEQLSQFESILIQSIKSVIGVPVIREGEVWGVILVDSRLQRREFNDQNLMLLDFFANLISLSLERIIRFEKLEDENRILMNRLEEDIAIPDMIGRSKPMREFGRLLHRVAQTDATVLLTGESGTGKDLAARAIHNLSTRKDKDYLAQFCGSIPDSLLESELFGYRKGAFTGANSDKKGLLEIADKGTFFLDEIADISVALQAKLLRVLENQEIIRLGDTQVKNIDVRIIAATNKDLKQLVKEGKFREDLYYRLNVLPVKLPPLRERKGDVALMAKSFVEKFSDEPVELTAEAMRKLDGYNWPGNIRQLINVIRRALVFCNEGKIKAGDIVLEEEESAVSFKGTLADFELQLLKKRLEECNGNRSLAAETLGVSRRWVQMKIKEIDGV